MLSRARVLLNRLGFVPTAARKLFCVIVREAYHGPMRPKPPGVATPAEILEACGLDVGEFYALLDILKDEQLIEIRGDYPLEEIRLTSEGSVAEEIGEYCRKINVPLENVLAGLDTSSLPWLSDMTLSTFELPRENRYFEDYEAGRVYEFGSVVVTEPEIIDFALRFDPQDMHIDPERARQGRFGGIIASGWHTIGLAMRLYVNHFLSAVASLASPGVDEVRWPNPVRPGDSIHVRITILETIPSRSKRDRGVVRARLEAFNQNAQPVLSLIALSILGRRQPAGKPHSADHAAQ
jgi:acyl dehydratase